MCIYTCTCIHGYNDHEYLHILYSLLFIDHDAYKHTHVYECIVRWVYLEAFVQVQPVTSICVPKLHTYIWPQSLVPVCGFMMGA